MHIMPTTRKSIVFCLIGPAGSGKTSLTKKLIESPGSQLKKLVSATSRAPRPGEVDGINYKFMTRKDFEASISKGEFFEWEEIHGNLYGQLRSSVEKSVGGDVDTILDIDIRGAASVEQVFPKETVVIFLLPPSEEILKQRIIARAPISEEELAKRLATSKVELDGFRQAYTENKLIDYFLVNSIFEDTLSALWNIVKSERQKLSRATPETILSLIG